MSILEEIVSHKKKELEIFKVSLPLNKLKNGVYFNRECYSLKDSLTKSETPGIIAEFKRKSPSKGTINKDATIEEVTTGYTYAGAKAISILTEIEYFGGNSNDLSKARKFNAVPILRKDFIIDKYQIYEAKAIGADIILLISSILTKSEVLEFSKIAKDLGLEILFEIHSEKEMESLNKHIDFVGVNNRDLKTFDVNIETSLELSEKIPSEFIKISESGLNHIENIVSLYKAGYKAFLMGEAFMKYSKPDFELEKLITLLNNKYEK